MGQNLQSWDRCIERKQREIRIDWWQGVDVWTWNFNRHWRGAIGWIFSPLLGVHSPPSSGAVGLHVFSPQNIQWNLDFWGMFAGNEESYGHGTLMEVGGGISVKYSHVYLESIALLGVALWANMFRRHSISSGIWTFGVCLLGTSRADYYAFHNFA